MGIVNCHSTVNTQNHIMAKASPVDALIRTVQTLRIAQWPSTCLLVKFIGKQILNMEELVEANAEGVSKTNRFVSY